MITIMADFCMLFSILSVDCLSNSVHICVVQGFANLGNLVLDSVGQALVEAVLEQCIILRCLKCMLSKGNNV